MTKRKDKTDVVITLFCECFWEMVKGGVYPPLFQPNGGTGKTSPQEVLPRAPTCPNFNSEALARCPQPMPTTNTDVFLFFFVDAGANGTAAQEGFYEIPCCFYLRVVGVYAPASLLYLLRITPI